MKAIFTILLLLSLNQSLGQNFHLNYWVTGLVPNAGLEVEINDTLLTFSISEKTEKYNIDLNDTVWIEKRNFYNFKFRRSSIDSIISILDTLHGKYVYGNPIAMPSNGLFYYSIEYAGKCSHFVMRNSYDNTALKITNLINSYLEEKYQIYIPNSILYKPKTEDCPRTERESKPRKDVILK